LLFVALAVADIYSPFQRTKVIQGRINKMFRSEKSMDKYLKKLEDRERAVEKKLADYYKDMKYAVSRSDRRKLEVAIEKMQTSLQNLRKKEVSVKKKMRIESDKITQPFRDNIARMTGIDEVIGLENEDSFIREKLRVQNKVVKFSTELAKKYASLAAEIAALKGAEKNKKVADITKESQQEYVKTYKAIISLINKRVANGVSGGQVEDVCQEAIEPIVNRLIHERALIPNADELEKTVQSITSKIDKQAPVEAKKEEKKVEKKEEKKVEKKAEPKKEAAKPKKTNKKVKRAQKKVQKAQKNVKKAENNLKKAEQKAAVKKGK
jgi:hypothetical protein